MKNEHIEFVEITPELLAIVGQAIAAACSYQVAVGGKRKLGITGEVGEVLVCNALGLRMTSGDREAGYDAIDKNGLTVQIKTRRSEVPGLPSDVGRMSKFSDHDFNYALLALLDHDYELREIWLAEHDDIAPVIDSQKRRSPTLRAFKKVARQVFP